MLKARKTLVVLMAAGMVLAAQGAAVAASTYTGAVQADGPLAYYRLDETGSVPATAADATTNGNDGTYQNQLVLGSAGPRPSDGFAGFSDTNTAPEFNKQANDYITMPAGFLPTGSQERTVEGWFFSTDNAHNHDQTFFNYGPNNSGDRMSITADGGRVTVAVSGHEYGKTGLALGAGWHHVAVVLPDGENKSNKFKLYVDGAQLTGLSTQAGSTRTITTVDSNRRIGRSSGTETYAGQIDELAVYGTDLSADQIRDHYLTALVGGDRVLLHDHFLNDSRGTGDTGSVNGGFNKVTNSAGGSGSTSESGTNVSVSTSAGGSDNTGIVSINTFDPTGDPTNGFTATWVITSASDPEANGINLTLQSGDGFFNTGAGRPNLLFRFDSSNDSKFHLLANDGSTSVDLLTADPITMSEVLDGFTFSATLNAAGWSYSATGLDSLADNSGLWIGSHNYGTLFDSDTHVGAFIQTGSSGSKAMAVDRITLTRQAAPVPEPATMVALFAAVTGLGGYVRKRKRLLKKGTATMVKARKTLVVLMAAGMFLAAQGAATAATVLVGPGVGNGDFNDGTADSYSNTPFWQNIGTGDQTQEATRTNLDYDGTRNHVMSEGAVRLAAQDTGHTIADGDLFDVSYVWRDAYQWIDGSDQVAIKLFTTNDDLIGGTQTTFATMLSGTSTANETYESVTDTATATASEAGKTLFVAIDTQNGGGGADGFARLDNFQLQVTPASISATILQANFDGSPLRAAGDAVSSADLDAGTTGGTWTVNDDQESVIGPETSDASNHALAGDRGPYDFDLAITGAAPTLATDQIVVSFDSQIVRTSNNPNEKKSRITGWDSSNNQVFQIVLTTDGSDGSGTPQGRLKYVNQSGSEVLLVDNLESVGGNPTTFSVNDMSDLRIELGATTMDIFVNNVLQADDVAYRTAGVTDLASLSFTGSGGDDSNAAGAWYDNIEVVATPQALIPEPATMVALLAAVTGLGGYVRRRKRS